METTAMLIALPILAFVTAWALAHWRAQRENQQLHTDLEVTRAELARMQESQVEQQATLAALTRDKAALDMAGVRLQAERDHALGQLERQERSLSEQQGEIRSLRQSEHLAREACKGAEIQAQEAQKSLASYQQYWESAKAELKALEVRYAALSNQHSELRTSLDEKQQHFAEQLKLLQDSRESLKKEFEHLASEILERKGKAFKELNHESISNLLNPIHTEMKGFKAKVEDIHARDAEQRIQLRTELQNMQKLNREITDQADKLTTALRGQKKVQGNWGELMLENVLDNSGLRLGIDYRREVSFNTEDGRQRPDAIVYLPQHKHLIIDAKTSLVAYTEYVNADNDAVREHAIAEHARAVSDRINELAERDYFKLPGLNSPEVVVMFIPIESAYVEALKYDDTLFQRAIERNVLVATPTTLLTSLNIVRQLWRFEDQNKHTAELASRAEKFYSKLNGFLTSMQGVGNQLDRARQSYDKAFGQLYSGKGNLIKQASEFKDLGVSVQKELPVELVEKAHLELGEEMQGIEAVE
ncbi:DNA recombination protein RmuC [Marinobacterium rhizophilum]|uniref:DNA recombination protein RmuC n=1 Tax=Marinobacterium rhizophilum TaxID=420402 RepID=UPI0003826D62|nr:DNA recombination protein RmuC [Marinobacterium rhizophilum]